MMPRVPIGCSRHHDYSTVIYPPFLPSVPFHAEPAIPGTPADLLRFRSRRGYQAGYTERCARFRAAEYRNAP